VGVGGGGVGGKGWGGGGGGGVLIVGFSWGDEEGYKMRKW